MKILLLLLSLFLMACKKPLKVNGLKTFGTMGEERDSILNLLNKKLGWEC